jgi:putative membrane protein
MKRALRLAVALLGLALFGFFVHRAGVGEVLAAFHSMGALGVLVLAPYFVVYIFDTLGWRYAFGSRARRELPFWKIFRIRWCGEALNNVLPSAYVGGEALKVYLLRKCDISGYGAASSVIVGKTAQTLAQVIFLLLGAVIAFSIAQGGAGATALFVVSATAAVVVVLLFWLQTHGIFALLLKLSRKLGLSFLERKAESLRRLDGEIVEFYQNDRRSFFLSAFFYLCGWLLDVVEIMVASRLLGMPIDFAHAISIEAFIGVAKFVGVLVPGALGVQESSIVLLFRMFGLPDALGVSYAIIRRGREVVYAAIGGALFYNEEARSRGIVNRVDAEANL